jgi:hypothetical protein
MCMLICYVCVICMFKLYLGLAKRCMIQEIGVGTYHQAALKL